MQGKLKNPLRDGPMTNTRIREKDGKFYWVVTTVDGRVLAESSVLYELKSDCMEVARMNIPKDSTEPVIDETGRC